MLSYWLSVIFRGLLLLNHAMSQYPVYLPTSMSQSRSTRWSLGMGNLPPLMTGILISWGPINPYGLGFMFPIPYYMEILGGSSQLVSS